LILGFQLKYNLEWIFEKYKTNPLFSDFILNYLPKEERGGIAWSMDKKKGTITAVHNGVGVFRTTKYVANELKSIVEKYSFEFVYQDVDKYNNSCLQVYKRI
ncbi:hypothetical protein KKE06_05145, partial [Candidatus Micrarchaeota archaeon]|nr:hypothetical protein [Candidatus Micrarchaeota archaeon]